MANAEPACQCRKPRCHSSNALSIAVQHLGGAIEGVRQHGHLLLRAFQIALINRLVYSRNDHCGVAGILPRSVDCMSKPGAIGQALGTSNARSASRSAALIAPHPQGLFFVSPRSLRQLPGNVRGMETAPNCGVCSPICFAPSLVPTPIKHRYLLHNDLYGSRGVSTSAIEIIYNA